MSHPRLRRTDWATVKLRSADAENTRTSCPSEPRAAVPGGGSDAVTAGAGPVGGASAGGVAGLGVARSGVAAGAAPLGPLAAAVFDSSPTSTRSSEGSRAPPWRSIVTPKMSGDHVARGGATRSVPVPCASTASSPADTRFPRLMLPSQSWYVRPAGGCGRPDTTSVPPPIGSHRSCPRAPAAGPTGTKAITRVPLVGSDAAGSVRALSNLGDAGRSTAGAGAGSGRLAALDGAGAGSAAGAALAGGGSGVRFGAGGGAAATGSDARGVTGADAAGPGVGVAVLGAGVGGGVTEGRSGSDVAGGGAGAAGAAATGGVGLLAAAGWRSVSR